MAHMQLHSDQAIPQAIALLPLLPGLPATEFPATEDPTAAGLDALRGRLDGLSRQLDVEHLYVRQELAALRTREPIGVNAPKSDWSAPRAQAIHDALTEIVAQQDRLLAVTERESRLARQSRDAQTAFQDCIEALAPNKSTLDDVGVRISSAQQATCERVERLVDDLRGHLVGLFGQESQSFSVVLSEIGNQGAALENTGRALRVAWDEHATISHRTVTQLQHDVKALDSHAQATQLGQRAMLDTLEAIQYALVVFGEAMATSSERWTRLETTSQHQSDALQDRVEKTCQGLRQDIADGRELVRACGATLADMLPILEQHGRLLTDTVINGQNSQERLGTLDAALLALRQALDGEQETIRRVETGQQNVRTRLETVVSRVAELERLDKVAAQFDGLARRLECLEADQVKSKEPVALEKPSWWRRLLKRTV